MRRQAVLTCALVLAVASQASARDGKQAPQSEEQKTLYGAGAVMAQTIAGWSLTPDELSFVLQGFEDAASGKKPLVELEPLKPKIEEYAKARQAAAVAAEKKAAEPFLAQAAAEKGAVKTESGVIINVIKPGNGPKPKTYDKIKVHYRGALIDGTVFDSSPEGGEPRTFALRGMIPCWVEALQLMMVGEKVKLVCPADTAYGDRGYLPRIKPGAALVFDVELVGIEPSGWVPPSPTPPPPPKS